MRRRMSIIKVMIQQNERKFRSSKADGINGRHRADHFPICVSNETMSPVTAMRLCPLHGGAKHEGTHRLESEGSP